MKRKIFIYLVYSVVALVAASCGGGSTKIPIETATEQSQMEAYYTCTMHPEVHLDQPGKCPVCAMELVRKEVAQTDTLQMHEHSDSMSHNH